jgi:hypothetical protein
LKILLLLKTEKPTVMTWSHNHIADSTGYKWVLHYDGKTVEHNI